jgi:dUTP pyrophosphatase
MATLPTFSSNSESSIFGARKISSVQIVITATTPIAKPILISKGSEIIAIDGSKAKVAAKVPKFGRTRSLYRRDSGFSGSLTLNRLRWESMTHVPVLVMASPGFEPRYAKAGDAGADLRSTKKIAIGPGARELVPTGVSIALPAGFVGLVHPRSGLALKHGITVLNSPGTIDAGYRGEIMVTLYNSSTEKFEIEVGDRIAQLLIQSVEQANFIAVDQLPDSDRGQAGFGSTGSK